MNTVSKHIRAYLAKLGYPLPRTVTAKYLSEKYNCSIAMCYKLLAEHRQNKTDAAPTLALPPTPTPEPVVQDSPVAKTEPAKTATQTGPWTAIQRTVQELDSADKVNHPPHYTAGGIETIDFIESKGLQGNYYLANAIKYISRAPFKGEYKTDIEKAIWYLSRELKIAEAQSPAA